MRTSFILVAASVAAILSAAFAFPETVTVERTIDKVVRPVVEERTVSDVTRTEGGNIVTGVPRTTGVIKGVVDGTFAVVEPTVVSKTVVQTEDVAPSPRVIPVSTEIFGDVVGNRFITIDGKTTDVVQDVVREPIVTPVPTKVVGDIVESRFITVEGKTVDVVGEPVVAPVPTKVVGDVVDNRFVTFEGKTTDVVREPIVTPVPTKVVRGIVDNRFITVEGKTVDVVSEPAVAPVPTTVVGDVVDNRFSTVEGKTVDVIIEPIVTPVPTKIVRDIVGNKFITVGGKSTGVVGTFRGDRVVGSTTTIPRTFDSTGFFRVAEPITGEKVVTTVDQPVVTTAPVRVVRPVTVDRVTEGLNKFTRFVEVDPVPAVPTIGTSIVVDRFTDTVSLRNPFRVVRGVLVPVIKEHD